MDEDVAQPDDLPAMGDASCCPGRCLVELVQGLPDYLELALDGRTE